MTETRDGAWPAGDRRRFIKRTATAVVGGGAAIGLLGAEGAQADGGTPAYTDASNTFTKDQRIDAALGVGQSPTASLSVLRLDDSGPAVRVNAFGNAFAIEHTQDRLGACFDLVDLTLMSSGDAVFVRHMGGRPKGYSGASGGMAGFNVLVPYHRDGDAEGLNGTLVNDYTGQTGLLVATRAVVDQSNAIAIQHFSNSPAIDMHVQNPTGQPKVGTGGGIYIHDFSGDTANSITISRDPPGGGSPSTSALRMQDAATAGSTVHIRRTKPNGGSILELVGDDASNMMAIAVRNTSGATGLRVDSNGDLSLFNSGGRRTMIVGASGYFLHQGTQLGFFNHTMAGQQSVPVVATSTTDTRDLVNALRNALKSYGLVV
jgi:hypothetical protein